MPIKCTHIFFHSKFVESFAFGLKELDFERFFSEKELFSKIVAVSIFLQVEQILAIVMLIALNETELKICFCLCGLPEN